MAPMICRGCSSLSAWRKRAPGELSVFWLTSGPRSSWRAGRRMMLHQFKHDLCQFICRQLASECALEINHLRNCRPLAAEGRVLARGAVFQVMFHVETFATPAFHTVAAVTRPCQALRCAEHSSIGHLMIEPFALRVPL